MMQSDLILCATSGLISGSGLAIAKITGSLFKFFIISSVNAPAADTPIRTSAPLQASSRDVFWLIDSTANYSLNEFIPSFLPLKITPFVSQTKQLSFFAP